MFGCNTGKNVFVCSSASLHMRSVRVSRHTSQVWGHSHVGFLSILCLSAPVCQIRLAQIDRCKSDTTTNIREELKADGVDVKVISNIRHSNHIINHTTPRHATPHHTIDKMRTYHTLQMHVSAHIHSHNSAHIPIV